MSMKKIIILTFLLLTTALQYSKAQPAHLSFDHLGTKEGLPDNDIRDMIQDYQGYIWLATQRGIVRYDGYRLKVYKPGIEDKSNLPNFFITNIIEDKNHNVWVNSMNNGLFKYDRSADRFIQYKIKNFANKASQIIAGIDSTGKIWSFIDDYATLQQFDPATGIFELYGQSQKGVHHLDCKRFVSFFVDHKGIVWLGTNNGLYLYNAATDSFTGYLVSTDFLQRKIIYMMGQAPSAPGKLWISVMDKKDNKWRLLRMDIKSGQMEKFEHQDSNKNSLGNDTVSTVFEDKKHRLWLGTESCLSLYNEKTKQFTNYIPVDTVHGASKNHIIDIKADRNNKLWMTTDFGLLCFNPETGVFKRYIYDKDDPGSINGAYIEKLLFDRDGVLWAGLSFGGADKINPVKSAFTPLYAKSHKFPWREVHIIAKAPDGLLWIGASNGLYRYDTVKYTTKLIAKGYVWRLFVAKNNVVYYSGDDFGVYYPLTGKTERYKSNLKDTTSLSDSNLRALLEDHAGIIWIGTRDQGVCTFDPRTKKFKRYPYIINDNTQVSHDKLDDRTVDCIYEDRNGTVWVGTDEGGLNHLDRKRDVFISSFKPQEGLNCVTSINQDNKGMLWASSYYGGIFLVDNRTGVPIKKITEKDGLMMDLIPVIHADPHGFLWLGSARGFSRIKTSDFSIKNYKADGSIWENLFNGFNGGISDIDGNIFVHNGDKIESFDTRVIEKDISAPVVHITNILYSDSRLTKDSSVTMETYGRSQTELPWTQNKITFNYVAIHYTNAAENKYAYRLKGYDNHWIKAGTLRSTTYTNLSPGTYTFMVKAANSDDVWNNKGDSFTIIISPPWWQTLWAWVLYIVLFILAVYAFIAYRSRKLRHDKRILEETVKIRTSEVMEQKEEIMQQKEEIETQRDGLEKTLVELKATQKQLIQSEKMASLGELTAGIAHEIQNPLNFINNFSEVSRELIDELKEEIDKGDTDEVKLIAGDLEQNLEKINHHGKRADAIVKGMLEHSRKSSGHKELTDINALGDEYLRLAYHGMRAKDKTFSAARETDFDDKAGKINIIAQDIGRVLLNLFNNAFYAVTEKAKTAGAGYQPTVAITTKRKDGKVIIIVCDNGNGIPKNITDKIFQPFFTTKPTGQGTGLGLSLSYDIIAAHEGDIKVDTKEGEGTKFIISMPV